MDTTERLVAHFADATSETEATGGRWYRESRRTARALARKHRVYLSTSAGVIAALSPRLRWASNVALADAVLGREEVHGVFARNLEKAERIRDGERPYDVLGGPKVRAFYSAIMGNDGAAVVDVWMFRAADLPPNPKNYRIVEEALHEAARQLNIATATFQAIVWTHVRGGGE